MDFVFKLHGNTYVINGRTPGVLPSGVAKLSWAIPTPPVNLRNGSMAFKEKKSNIKNSHSLQNATIKANAIYAHVSPLPLEFSFL